MREQKKLKVFLLASPHPQFDEILDFPPEGIEYEKTRTKLKYHGLLSEMKIKLHNTLNNIIPIPRMIKIKTDANLIHSSRGIIIVCSDKPWIVDVECGNVFTSFNWKAMRNPLAQRIIRKALLSKNCKKILPQSEAAKRNLLLALNCKGFEDKIEILYLALRSCKKKKVNRKDGKVILSFIGKAFYAKGANDLLEAYAILAQKYKNLELRFKGDIPKEFSKTRLPGLKFIKGNFSRDKLFEKMYLNADIFVLPTHIDNYGLVYLEAMSAGLPLVGTTSFTVPEIIKDGKNGFLIKTDLSWENYFPYDKEKEFNRELKKIHPEIVSQLVEKLSILIENKALRERMGKYNRHLIEKGKFSIKERNKKLRRIYDGALK